MHDDHCTAQYPIIFVDIYSIRYNTVVAKIGLYVLIMFRPTGCQEGQSGKVK